MGGLLPLLSGGDRRSIGRANEVAERVCAQPELAKELADALTHDSDVVRMRAADALEKVAASNAAAVRPFRGRLVSLAARAAQQELRWHLAQILPRLGLTAAERARLVPVLRAWLADDSRIVQANALEALVVLALEDAALRPDVEKLVRARAKDGPPSLQARARRLARRLEMKD